MEAAAPQWARLSFGYGYGSSGARVTPFTRTPLAIAQLITRSVILQALATVVYQGVGPLAYADTTAIA